MAAFRFRRIVGPICLMAVLALSRPVRADLVTSVTSDVQALGGGLFQYSYSLKNLPSSTLPVVSFDLNVSTAANLSAIQSAAGFSPTYQAGATVIRFDTPATSGLAPDSVATFSF